MPGNVRQHLESGVVIPAHPLALTRARRLDERRQRALTRYYIDAGAGGIAVGVHTTQFAIRDPKHGLYEPVLSLAAETVRATRNDVAFERGTVRTPTTRTQPLLMVAGVVGRTAQAIAEAQLARTLGYDVVLLSLGALATATDTELIAHCRAVAEVMPVFGFYLQPAVGGRVLGYRFWREFAEIENVWAVKIAPFDRYRTLEAIRGLTESGRDDVALYTGNDDNIVGDLLTPFPAIVNGAPSSRRFVGGLLGQWAVWTRTAVSLLERVKRARDHGADDAFLEEGAALTDANSAIFDAANGFAGCIPGIHEVLRRQGLLDGTWCLDEQETLSPGQSEQIDRVIARYPALADDAFVAEHLDRWLA